MTTSNISEEDGKTLLYPKCVKCGAPWQAIDGWLLDYVWCSKDHPGSIWCCVIEKDFPSIDWELTIDGNIYDVRWKCNCMRPQCSGRNVIFETADYDNPKEVGVWYFEAPFTLSVEEVKAIVAKEPDEWE